ncbi:uncharacterized protein LOC120331306 [Styela clava]
MMQRSWLGYISLGREVCICGSPIVIQKRTRRNQFKINPAQLEQKMNNFMTRKKKFKKFNMDEEEFVSSTRSSSITCPKKANTKKLSENVIIRERNISNLLKTEIQNLVESGELGSEVQELNLTFTKSSMASQDICRILWEPDNSAKDVEIYETLNGLSGRIRHLLISSHVFGNIPKIQFYMDYESQRLAMADKILNEQELDIGPDADHVDSNIESDEEIKNTTQSGINDLNYDNLYSKLVKLKKTNKIDKS